VPEGKGSRNFVPPPTKLTTPFKIRVGQAGYADFLELSGGGTTGGTYRKTVQPPPGLAGRVTLREVELEDYAGNKAHLTLER
jgi:hypothetical protein